MAPTADGRCPACGEAALRPWRTARASDAALGGRAAVELVRCDACGSAAVTDGTAPPLALYEGGSYAPTRRVLRVLTGPAEALSYRLRLRLLEGLPQGARLLEVGAGDGGFLVALRRRGFRAEGVDPVARSAAGVRQAAVEELELAPESQDAIVLWHVLEHLDDPEAVLRGLVRALARGGRVLVAVPDLASAQARLGGDRWFHQDVPRHRVQFTRRGLEALLGRVGLRVERSSMLVPEQNLLGMWQTLLNRCTFAPDVAFRLVKGQLPDERWRRRVPDLAVSLVLGPALVVPAIALELGATALGRAGTLAVVAVKEAP